MSGNGGTAYEEKLTAYEKAAVKANIWSAVLPPIYQVISMAGVVFILYFGQKNVLGNGVEHVGYRGIYNVPVPALSSCRSNLPARRSCLTRCIRRRFRGNESSRCWRRRTPDDGQKPDEETCAANRLEVDTSEFFLSGRRKGAEGYFFYSGSRDRLSASPDRWRAENRRSERHFCASIPMKGRFGSTAGSCREWNAG